MIDGKRLTSSIPNDIGSRSRGSYPFAIARYISTRATATMMMLPTDKLKKAV